MPSRVAQVSVVLEPENGLLQYVRYCFSRFFILIPCIQQLSVATYHACRLCSEHLRELWVLPPEPHLASELNQSRDIGAYKLGERCDLLQLLLVELAERRVIRITAQLLYKRILTSCICGVHLKLLWLESGVRINLRKLKTRGPGIGTQIGTLRFVRIVIYLVHSCCA